MILNKKDLLQFKSGFDNKKRYMQYIGGEGPLYDYLTEDKIILMLDPFQAVDSSLQLMKNMIIHLSSEDNSYSGIAICPRFSVFVDSDFISEEGNITNKKGILNDYVGISFPKGYVYSGRKGKVFSVDELPENEYIVYSRFSDFVILLNEAGLELDGISSFDDIRDIISNDMDPLGKIEVSFNKKRSYSKIKR